MVSFAETNQSEARFNRLTQTPEQTFSQMESAKTAMVNEAKDTEDKNPTFHSEFMNIADLPATVPFDFTDFNTIENYFMDLSVSESDSSFFKACFRRFFFTGF